MQMHTFVPFLSWLTAAAAGVTLGAALCAPAWAQHDARQVAEDAQRHRALAQTQQISAKCFDDNRGKDVCIAEMKSLCIGLAIGKYCGLREEAAVNPSQSFQVTSQANLAAAECMEAGKPYENCIWDLQTACKGLGIGKFCGMVHAHSF